MKQQTLSGGTIHTIPIREIMVLPTTVIHPKFGMIRVIDYKRPYEYMDGLYAYNDAKTGEYGGMLVEDDTEVRVIEE